jgi:hypothetical protein
MEIDDNTVSSLNTVGLPGIMRSIRQKKEANENNGEYLSAGLRVKCSVSDEIKAKAKEIGFAVLRKTKSRL